MNYEVLQVVLSLFRAYYTLCFLSPFRKLSVTPLKPSSIISNNEERKRSFSQQKRNSCLKLIRASKSERGDDSVAQGTMGSKVIRAVNSSYQVNQSQKGGKTKVVRAFEKLDQDG